MVALQILASAWNKEHANQMIIFKELIAGYLAIILFMHGRATPSAIPSSIRMASRANKDVSDAHGVRKVARDHKATPQAMTTLPP